VTGSTPLAPDMRFAVPPGTDALALRLALVACRSPFRLERWPDSLSLVVRDSDAHRVRAGWLRCGLESPLCDPWPAARSFRAGVVEAGARYWCLARASLDRPFRGAPTVVLCAPISRDDALRAIARALRGVRFPFARKTRPLARTAAAILAGRDAVVMARAYALASGDSAAAALAEFGRLTRGRRLRPARLRQGALASWSEIAQPRSGVWRSLSALEGWWS
jgi:hypothetical protein